MERKRVLIADNDLTEIQELRQALIISGYEVRVVDSGASALKLCREFRPHLVLSEVQLPKIDGHHLVRELKSQAATKSIPFILMSRHRPVEERVHSIMLGIDDYISKPFDVQEVLVRFEIILKEVETLESTPQRKGKGFSGKLSEMNLIDLLRTLDIGKKNAIVKVLSDSNEGIVFVKNGEIIDVSLADLKPKEALLRMFTWSDGSFRVELKEIDRPKVVKESLGNLLYEGSIHKERWDLILKNLPPLQALVKPNPNFKDNKLNPDEKSLIHILNGNKRFIDLIEGSQLDDLKALQIISKLYSRGLLVEVPLEEDMANGKSLLKENQSSRQDLKSRSGNLVARFVDNQKEYINRPEIERRQGERRQHSDRRIRPRRWSDVVGVKNKIYLNKSELIMIRERLAQGLNSENSKNILY